MHGFYLLNLASLLYFSGWLKSTCFAVLLSSECEKFSGIFSSQYCCCSISSFAFLFLSFSSFAFLFLSFMCQHPVIFLHLPLQSVKRVIKHWACSVSLGTCCVDREQRRNTVLKHFFFNAHTITQEEIVVGDMLRRNDLIFRPNAAKCRLAE